MAYDGTGIPLHALDMHEYTGTLSTTADETEASKIVVSDRHARAYNLDVRLQGEGAYLEGGVELRDGINFPTAAAALAATTLNEARLVRLTDTLYVAVYHAANNTLSAMAMTLSGTTLTAGSAAAVNTGDTDSIALCRINATTFGVAYNDEVGDDYLCFRTGTVSGTTVTMGTEKATTIAPTEDEIALCYEPTSACLVAAYADASDGLSAVAVPVTSAGVIGTVGTAVVLDASSTPTETTIAPIQAGYCVGIYADAGEDSGKIHGIAFAVSSAGAISGAGTEKTVVDAAGTLCTARYVRENTVAIGYIDASADPAVIVITTSGATGTTITAGTAVVMAAATATDIGMDMIDADQGICCWCDDAHANDVGYAIRFTLSGTGYRTVTADATVDKFIDATAKGGTLKKMDIACASNGKCVIVFNDSGNDPAVVAGQYFENRIVDVRSNAASAVFVARLFPLYKGTYTSTAT